MPIPSHLITPPTQPPKKQTGLQPRPVPAGGARAQRDGHRAGLRAVLLGQGGGGRRHPPARAY